MTAQELDDYIAMILAEEECRPSEAALAHEILRLREILRLAAVLARVEVSA